MVKRTSSLRFRSWSRMPWLGSRLAEASSRRMSSSVLNLMSSLPFRTKAKFLQMTMNKGHNLEKLKQF